MSEKHIIKISVELRQVKLLVRFPCKLTFQLKTDTAHAETRNAYELKKGQCQVGETIEAEAEVQYDPLTGQYEEKKVRLTIQMSSTNGVIPAGSVTFNPCNKEYLQRVEYTLPLEKCPDRSAQITFFQSFQLLRKTTPEAVYQSQFAERITSRVVNKYSASNVLAPAHQLQKASSRDISSNSRNRLTPTNNRGVSPKQRVKTTLSGLPYRQDQQQYNEFGESQVLPEEGYQKYASKYVEPAQKTQYIKQIARLKGELKTLQAEDRWDQVIRIKEENEVLTAELEKARERVRGLERREREVALQLKEVREEAERNKNKYLQAETARNEGEIQLGERERTVKEASAEARRLEERIQELTGQLANQQKRVQFKENSYQEQLRKLNEKYTQSQNERQKLTFDYNSLLAKLEEAEKRNQAAAKEKDRAATEERNKLNKRIDQLTQSLDKLKEEQAERETQLTEALTQLKAATKRESEREEKLGAVEGELELTKMLLKKELDQRRLHQKEIEDYKVIEEERNTLRKRNNEVTAEVAKQNERIERISSELAASQGRVRELQGTLLQRTKEKEGLNNKLNTLRKELDALKKQQERRTRQQETLSVQHFNAGQKINDLKSKLDTQKRDAEQMKLYYQEQLAYLAKTKEYADNEIEELKWSLQKAREQHEDTNGRLKQANAQILRLNQDILVSAEKLKRAEDENKDLVAGTNALRKDIAELEQKERVLNEQLKGRGETNYDLQKKLQAADSELFVLREKLRQTEAASQERRSGDEKALKERERGLAARGQEVTQLQLEVITLKEEAASAAQDAVIKSNEIAYLKDALLTAKQDAANRELKAEEVREQLRTSTQALQTLTKEHETLGKIVDEEKKASSKLRKDWEDYRRDTTKALQRLIEEIGKEEQGSSKHSLLSFPDQTISVMQVEAIKKRAIILTKYQSRISELQQELALLDSQLKKAKKNAAEKEEQLEKSLKQQREKTKNTIVEHNKEREELQARLETLEERRLQLTTDLEKATNEVKKREEVVEELTQQIKAGAEEREGLKAELRAAEEAVLALKSSEIKWKVSNQSKISEIAGQNESVIERYKISVADLEKRLSTEQKAGKEREESIKRAQGRISELTYEKERSQAKVQELTERISASAEERKELQRKIKALEKEVKEGALQLQAAKEALANEKAKFDESQSKLNETYSALSEAQVLNEKLRAEGEAKRATVTELEEAVKQRSERLRVAGEKSALQVKQLKEKIISLNSTIQLRDFQVGQNELQITTLRQALNEAKEELQRRKQEAIKLGDRLQEYKNQDLYTSQNIEILKSEKEFLEEENDRLKERVASLEEELAECHLEIETAEARDRQLTKTREEVQTLRLEKDKLSSELRNAGNTRLSGIAASRVGGGEERKRVRELEQLLESKHIDLSIERKKLLNEFDREKRALLAENAELRDEISNLQSQFDFQRSQLNKQIESLGEDCEKLTAKLLQKEELIASQQQLLQALNGEGNSEQVQECISNIKTIFSRMDRSNVQPQPHLLEAQALPDEAD